MNPPKPLLERAFEIARSGDCAGLLEIRAVLHAEGYRQAQSELTGLSLKRQLKRLCNEARSAEGETR